MNELRFKMNNQTDDAIVMVLLMYSTSHVSLVKGYIDMWGNKEGENTYSHLSVCSKILMQ